MNNFYFLGRECLWILPPKNATTSIKSAIGAGPYLSREAAEQENRTRRTVGVVRHPYDRLLSAAYTVHMSGDGVSERIHRNLQDSHVRPQYPAFEGLRVDHLLCFDRLQEDWERLRYWIELPQIDRLNVGSRSNGRPSSWEGIDWSEFAPLYKQDMTLWQIASKPR